MVYHNVASHEASGTMTDKTVSAHPPISRNQINPYSETRENSSKNICQAIHKLNGSDNQSISLPTPHPAIFNLASPFPEITNIFNTIESSLLEIPRTRFLLLLVELVHPALLIRRQKPKLHIQNRLNSVSMSEVRQIP